MKMKTLVKTAAMLAMAGNAGLAAAVIIPTASISIDGNLSDWGVSLANNNASNIMPKGVAPGSSSSKCLAPLNGAWACEDSNDNGGGGGYVGPQYGGQDYDVQFLATWLRVLHEVDDQPQFWRVFASACAEEDKVGNLYVVGQYFRMLIRVGRYQRVERIA